MKYNKVLGIDIGGSGVKGAPVNTDDGLMLESRYRIPTPTPATPQNVAPLIAEIAKQFKWEGPIGCGFPGVMQNGVAKTAANLDDSWIETDINKLFKKATGLPVSVINDADAAGLAEMKFGAGVDTKGVVLLCTIGTGIGTVMFVNGTLVPNTEFGHIELMGMDAEKYATIRSPLGATAIPGSWLCPCIVGCRPAIRISSLLEHSTGMGSRSLWQKTLCFSA